VLSIGASVLATSVLPVRAFAQDAERHGMSAFGDLGYPADFANFKYVEVNAPKGGAYSEIVSSRG
jgi:microcin C transport system substrate-binding protein